jgi:hypothetical protein
MPIAILGMDGGGPTSRDVDASPNNFTYASFRLSFSGSYSTGGDPLDLSAIAGLIPAQTLLNAFCDSNGTGTQQGAVGGYYQVLGNQAVPTALNAYKLKIFSSGGAEQGAGAYPAAITGDYVVLQLQFRKLQ